jgi:hypothetical protein
MHRGPFVVAAESVHGGRLAATHTFFGDTEEQARARFLAYEARKAFGVAPHHDAHALGQAPPALVWHSVAPSGGDYSFASGERYAVLASVSKNYSKQEVSDYLTAHGWTVTYAWEEGQAGARAAYPIDAWLDSLAPDVTSNHRWLYAEANRTGPTVLLGVSAPWPLTIYQIANVFQAVPAPPGLADASAPAPFPSSPPTAAPPTRAPAIALVGGGFALGLAASLAIALARRLL